MIWLSFPNAATRLLARLLHPSFTILRPASSSGCLHIGRNQNREMPAANGEGMFLVVKESDGSVGSDRWEGWDLDLWPGAVRFETAWDGRSLIFNRANFWRLRERSCQRSWWKGWQKKKCMDSGCPWRCGMLDDMNTKNSSCLGQWNGVPPPPSPPAKRAGRCLRTATGEDLERSVIFAAMVAACHFHGQQCERSGMELLDLGAE
ncbi:MAG: hypothetical protein JWR26_727 [Pedosphaera sp.]|nr:hypothetical protein [Pedosphaera sp.]